MRQFFFPIVALLALAACSKVSSVEEPGQAVTFEVANYAARTKADNVSLATEFNSFHTYAIYHSTDTQNPNQWFMQDVEVVAQGGQTITKWAPARPYYWPKTGDISFYSYAGTRTPDVYPQPGAETKMVFGKDGATGTDLTINAVPVAAVADGNTTGAAATNSTPADNILVADPAFKFKGNVDDPYGVDKNLNPTTGVPTLFHHMLAKVRFQVILDAQNRDENTTWTATIPAQKMIEVPNQGSLVVTYPAATTSGTAPFTSAVWTLASQSSKGEVLAKATTLEAKGGVRNPAAGADPVNLIAETEYVVIPQAFGDFALHFKFDLKTSYQASTGSPVQDLTETINLEDLYPGLSMKAFAPNANAWNWEANHIYTYTITIKPNEEVLFDPAVVKWEEESYTYTY